MMQTRTERRTAKNGARRRGLRIFSWKEKLVALVLVATVPLATMPSMAFALPHGGRVTKGQATLSYGTNRLLINQSTAQASFSWTGFHVGSAQTVRYRTPGSRSVSMNFIGGTSPATIDGKVTSNGILTFMDANGLVFGSGSTVSASGIRAYGAAAPGGTPTGPVTNEGVLSAGPAGQVVLVGTDVTNTGTIDAPSGQVILAAGSTVTVSQTPSSSLSVAATGGGTVLDSGVIKSENLDGTPGAITLEAGMGSGTTTLTRSAVLDASAPSGGNGGRILIDGSGVVMNNTMPVNVSSAQGTPGTVSIDPNYLISGSTFDACDAAGLEHLDTHQSHYLANTVNLMANANLATGSTNYPWKPLGNCTTPFTGTFNGNGHTVSGYTITATNINGTGFIGSLGGGGTVKNLGVAGTVNGGSYIYVGGVVGLNNGGTVETSYNTGAVSGSTDVGGVAGENTSYTAVGGKTYLGIENSSYNTGLVSGSTDVGGVVGGNISGQVVASYNTGLVSGTGTTSFVGGVVGENGNGGIVEYSYNTGSVTGVAGVGGVVGSNLYNAQVQYSYNTGRVSGSTDVGGVVGSNNNGSSGSGGAGGVAGCNYFLSSTATYAIGNITSASGTYGTNVALSSFSTTTPTTTFANWSSQFNTWSSSSGSFKYGTTSHPWFEGTVVSGSGTMTAPMLVSDLSVATVTENSGSSVYNGSTVTTNYTATYTMGGSSLPSGISVSTSPSSVGPSAGSYTATPSISGTISLPSTQTSIGSVSAVSGTWTITPAPLTVTGTSAQSRTYNGTDTVLLSGATLSGTIYGTAPGLSNDTTGTLGNSGNAGTDSVTTAMTLTGSGAGNYALTQPTISVDITPAPLTVTGTSAKSRTYNGTDTVSLTGATLSGNRFGNSISLASDTSGKLSNSGNAGTDSVTTAMTLSGTGASNFTLTQPTISVDITPAPLSFTGSLSNPTMTYDGGTSVALTPSNSTATLSGFVPGQGATYTGGMGTFSSSSAGTHTVTATLTAADFSGSGTGGFSWSNYSLPSMTLSGTGTILPANVSSGTGGGSGGAGGGGFSNLAVPPPIENLVENMNQSPSTPPLAVSSASGGNVMSSGGTGDGILDVSDLP